MTIKAQTGPGSTVPEEKPMKWGIAIPAKAFVGERISRDDLYMEVARLFALRSTCTRGHVGCVAVVDNHIIAAGYNGAPPGMPHCLDVGCGGAVKGEFMGNNSQGEPQYVMDFPNGCTRATHAEQNMVAFAARHGTALDGAAVYSTHAPCLPCAQALVASGVSLLVYEEPYRLPQGLELVDQANIRVERYKILQ